MVIAGWDAKGGPQVFGCPIGGTLVPERWAVDGSGSTYIWGYCDSEFRRAPRRRRRRPSVCCFGPAFSVPRREAPATLTPPLP